MPTKEKKLYFLTEGNEKTPSTRLRWLNFFDNFRTGGFTIITGYPRDTKERLEWLKQIQADDIVVIQKFFPSIKELRLIKGKKARLFFDIDDTIWLIHPQRKKTLKRVVKSLIQTHINLPALRLYDTVICANRNLEGMLKKYCRQTVCIPTSPSDPDEKLTIKEEIPVFRIVWSGTSLNYSYLDKIKDQTGRFLNEHQDAELCIISEKEYSIPDIERPEQIRNVVWSVTEESRWIQNSSLGIMPLTLDDWSNGKSAFKLIRYMKLKVPVLATDFGFQRDFIENGKDGVLIDNDAWYDTLCTLYNESKNLPEMGELGYEKYNKTFSPEIIFSLYKELF